MIKLLKYLFIFVVFLEALIIFAPKQRLFNALLHELDINKVNLNSYVFSEDLFFINLKNTNLLYDDIDIAKVNQTNIESYVFYNEIKVNKIKIDESLNSILPSKIDEINIVYSILNPLYVDINVYSPLYKAKGYVDILNKKLIMSINLSKQFKSKYPKIMRQLKFDKDTKEYIYEYSL